MLDESSLISMALDFDVYRCRSLSVVSQFVILLSSVSASFSIISSL